ncbi:hypothetical protein [Streptomyces luteireticuli]|uniref:Uncharacterized protein n=1 Tax=Streptomyces luteireticuli TaxID=173858 RepID=A0ABN0YR07_9ACTN
MTPDDPFADVSPWNTPTTPITEEKPLTNPTTVVPAAVHAPMAGGHKVRVTLKGGTGYDAPWVTIDGTDIADAAAQLSRTDEVKRLLDAAAKAGSYFASTGTTTKSEVAPKRFENGKVVPSGSTEHQGVTTCPHGRTHVAKGGWEAYFCNADERAGEEKCPAAFLNKKTGRFELKLA